MLHEVLLLQLGSGEGIEPECSRHFRLLIAAHTSVTPRCKELTFPKNRNSVTESWATLESCSSPTLALAASLQDVGNIQEFQQVCWYCCSKKRLMSPVCLKNRCADRTFQAEALDA